jgi:hypothetical protein
MVSPTISELTEQARELTAAVGQTKEYHRWWSNLLYACRKLQLMRAERKIEPGELDVAIEAMKVSAIVIMNKCDDWLETNEAKLNEIMMRIVD